MAAVNDPMTWCTQDREVAPRVETSTPFPKLSEGDDMVSVDASPPNLAVHGYVVSATTLACIALLALGLLSSPRVAALESLVPAKAAFLLEIGLSPFRLLVARTDPVDLFCQTRVKIEHPPEIFLDLSVIWDVCGVVRNGGNISGFVSGRQWRPASPEVNWPEVKAVALG